MLKDFFLFLVLILFYCFHQYYKSDAVDLRTNTKEYNTIDDFNSFRTSDETFLEVIPKNEDNIREMKSFYGDQDKLHHQNFKMCNHLVETVDNSIQRYISLFLITTNLLERKVTDDNEEIRFDLEISITGKDLSYLQNFEKNSKGAPYIVKFSKLDGIFSTIARAKEKSYMESSTSFLKSLFFIFINMFSIFGNHTFQSGVLFLLICAVIWLLVHLFLKHLCAIILVVTNGCIIWEGMNRYNLKLKEADAEIYIKTQQKLRDCDPDNMPWYQNTLDYFFGNKCQQIFSKSPSDEVSLFHCIVDSYAFYLVKLPVKLFGTSIRDLTGDISALWPWPVRLFASVPLALIILVFVSFFILILTGKRLRLSFFGASLDIGDTRPKQVPKTTYSNRKLKPWTRYSKLMKSISYRNLQIKPTDTTEMQVEKKSEMGSSGESTATVEAKQD